MRLLKINGDGSFSLTRFNPRDIPPYAILSHTWEADSQELSFQDMVNGAGRSKAGYRKIQFCGDQAKKDNLEYFWVDSCCIDKLSSAELSEAINSMFHWYRTAARCYVYLSDVLVGNDSWVSSFGQSRWFTRGWTLQELLAPLSVEFFSRDGTRLGDKKSFEFQIHQITGIAAQALQGDPLPQFSVEERMEWAERRETTIEEDQAYCLLGVFDISLPLIYGEGKKKAFRRLREEIDKTSIGNGLGKDWSEEKIRCLQVLRTSDYEQFKDRNPDRLDRTCEWFLKHDYYQQWRQSSSSGLLWVSADPGCGKSVLAKFLVDREIKATESRTTCYFFFKDDSDKQKSITIALSALLHQLISQKESLIQHAMQHYKVEGNKLPWSFHKLWSILIGATSDPKAGEVFCILDAVDECAEAGRYQIIDTLSALYKQSTSRRSGFQLKFLITSRPYFDIERRFAHLVQNVPKVRLRGEKELEAVSREINIVIKSKVSELAQDLALDDSEQLILKEELLGMTHRTYLWLRLIVEVIRDEISLTKKRLKRIIGTLPATVDEAYETILSRVKDRDRKRVQKLLHIIVAATRPLTLKEMNIALVIENRHRSYDDLDLENGTRFESSIRSLCGLFVSVMDQKVYLIHQTAKEFLITNGEVIANSWKHSLNPADSELLIARTCIIYLMFTIFGEDSAKWQVENHGYLDYAAKFWADHYRKAQKGATGDLLQMVLEICETQRSRFQIWWPIYLTRIPSFPELQCSTMVASYLGHEAVVKKLLETGNVDLNTKDSYGRTPLSCAAVRGHEAVVKLLLETGQVDVDSKDAAGRTPLSYAAMNGHSPVVKLLLETGQVDVNWKDNIFGGTPLWWAVGDGQLAMVKLLLGASQINVDSKDNNGQTPLSIAAGSGQKAVVELLLGTGQVDMNSKDNDGRTPLQGAVRNNDKIMVQLLLERSETDVDEKDKDGRTSV